MLGKRNTGHIYSTHSEQLPSMIHNIKQLIKKFIVVVVHYFDFNFIMTPVQSLSLKLKQCFRFIDTWRFYSICLQI